MSRGIRNNNPLNIRRGASRWVGRREIVTDKEFEEFTSMPFGYRAAWKLMDTYRILMAMTCVECGIRPDEVDKRSIEQGWTMAFGE